MKETLNFDERFHVGLDQLNSEPTKEFWVIPPLPEDIKSYIRELLESLRKPDRYSQDNTSELWFYNERNAEINSQIDTILKNL